jgi:hypothetical protein
MNILIFDTEQGAIDAEAEISNQMGLPKYGINAATQEVDFNSIQIERWDIPRQLEDGKWTITSPNGSDAIGWVPPEGTIIKKASEVDFAALAEKPE